MNADEDRQTFRAHVIESDRLAVADDIVGANAETDALAHITGPWEQSGQLAHLLAPLLAVDEPLSVRFNAASFLLHRGYAEEAVTTLEAISDGEGMQAVSARVILDRWRQQNA